ncbi:ribulokinase [Hymenobacter sp.]|uniref:ribulokinase n=1 Tax=Hymenobacter sp. TaxID=1898978 RepID=UPI00286BC81B|nr:ribulokinase [Hymenobacter sp.]
MQTIADCATEALPPLVMGVDFGTDSVRVLVVNAHTGQELSHAVCELARWQAGYYCNPEASQFRQHPLDHLESLEQAAQQALAALPAGAASRVRGMSVDTTGSTAGPVDEQGTLLALRPEFADNPHAMFTMWKDHTANAEAAEITALARRWSVDYTKYVGGIYSSEWFWAKIMHTVRVDESVAAAAFSWVEHCDWISAQLTGNPDPLTLRRSRCAAGHKAMWHEEFDGLPSQEFLTTLDPRLIGLRARLYQDTYTADQAMGVISAEWAARLGLPADVVIGVGAYDAHMGAVGANIQPYTLVKVTGTSTCDILTAPAGDVGGRAVCGICGQVDGSVVPGLLGLEAGQSAFGDLYAWLRRLVLAPVTELLEAQGLGAMAAQLHEKLLPHLSEVARRRSITAHDPVALDWVNGRRTPDANHELQAALTGLHLGTDAAGVFKALVEATAFGSRRIVERFAEEGIRIQAVVAIGGVARKSAFAMQTLADVLNVPLRVAASDQCCALGAAICAAAVAGVYADIPAAQRALASGTDMEFLPRPAVAAVYDQLYARYLALGSFIENVGILPPAPALLA